MQRATVEKLIVSGTAFSVSCAAFFLGIVMLVPVVGYSVQALRIPEVIQQIAVFLAVFAPPIAGALWGIHVGSGLIRQNSSQPAS